MLKMAQLLFLVVSLIGCLAPSIHATSHLQFANGTRVNVTRTGCGNTKLCLEDPEGCDPAAGSCLFGSVTAGLVEASNGSSLSITLRLSGESNQYVALGLNADQPEGTTTVFVCGQTNGSFQFFTAKRNNRASDGVLTLSETPVEDIQGQLTGRMVQCSFTVPNVNAMATGGRHVSTFIVELGTGVINGNKPGPFSLVRMEGPQDLANLTNNGTLMKDNITVNVDNNTVTTDNTTVTVVNITVTTDNTTVTIDNTTVTSDNTTVTVVNITVTTDNITVTTDNITVTTDNITVTTDNITVTTDNITVTTDNITVTTDNSTTPVNNTTTPVNNTTTPVENSTTTPADSNTTPADSNTTPADSNTTPADSNTTPADNNTTTPAPMIYTKTPVTNATMQTSMTSIQNISGSFSSSASLLLWSFLTWFALRRM